MPTVRVETAPVVRVCHRKARIGDANALLAALASGQPAADRATKARRPEQSRHTPPMARTRTRTAMTPLVFVALGGASVALSGCAAIGDIFKAGVWVGVVMVVGIVALVAGGMAMFRR